MRIYKQGKESHLFIDYTNTQFGELTALEYCKNKSKYGRERYVWKCKCSCGEICYIPGSILSSGSRIDCRTCSKKRQSKKQTLPDNTASLKRDYRTYKGHALKKNREFSITFDEFIDITKKDCHYCGSSPKKYCTCVRNGIDRIDSSIGYTKDNIVPCCEMCNRAKLDNELSVFLEWINKVHTHVNRKT